MENFAVIISFLLIGMALRRIPAFHDETGNVLSLVVIYISLPALVLLKIPELVISGELLVPVLLPWVMLLFSLIVIVPLSKMFQWKRETTGCLLLLIPLGNTSFLGIPMVKAFFGEGAIPYALLYDQLGTFLALATYGSVILALYAPGGSRPTFAGVMKKVVSFPPFIALITAFLLRTVPYPSIAVNILSLLASTLIPLVMIAVGFQLSFRMRSEEAAPLGIGLSIKLVMAPAAALLLCRLAGLQGEAVNVSIYESGMPPMVSAGALAIVAKLSPALSVALVAVGIVLSFVTLPVLYRLLA